MYIHILKEGGSIPLTTTPLVIKVVLLHTEQIVQRHFYSNVCVFLAFDFKILATQYVFLQNYSVLNQVNSYFESE